MNNSTRRTSIALLPAILLLACNGLIAGEAPAFPDSTHDGLERIENTRSDAVYMLPGADLSGYTEILLMEPFMAFNKEWKDKYNSSVPDENKVTSKDMERILNRGGDLFMHIFTDTMEEFGYPVVKWTGPNVLLVKPSIINLEIASNVPLSADGTPRGVATGEGLGSMTFVLELYDSESHQILVRAVDTAKDIDKGWRVPRDLTGNSRGARMTFDLWAVRLAKGLNVLKGEQ